MQLEQFYQHAEGNQEILNWINTVIKKQISKKPETTQEEIEHILDYLKSDKAPKRLRRASYEQMKNSAEKWTKSLQKKGNNIIETEEDVEVIKVFKKQGLKLVKLLTEDAYKREGNLMRHCVASYYDNYNCEIYSLRDSQNNPHATIEVQILGNNIEQIKGKGNGSIHPKYIKAMLKSLKILGNKVNVDQLQYMGYVKIDSKLLNILDRFYDYKYLTFKGEKFIYKYYEPKRLSKYTEKDVINALKKEAI